MEISTAKLYEILSEQLPRFQPSGEPERLEGGNLNHVWRLKGEPRNLIIKHAPPYIASNPEVPLSSNRIDFEARALKLFELGEMLHKLASERIRPPKVLLYEPGHSLLVMEDIGPVPAIDFRLSVDRDAVSAGEMLGRFIGQLHKTTFGHTDLPGQFNNQAIQETRNRVQYQPAAGYARDIVSVPDEAFETNTKSLGKKLMQPGRCLVMGDLWPASILVSRGNLRLIDWEFVHFGRPLQDAGHFAAHCWMQAHASPSPRQARRWKKLWQSFWHTYRQTTGEDFKKLFDPEERTFMNIHIAAEILVRAAGPFKSGYLYSELPPGHPLIKEAVKSALHISEAGLPSIWDSQPSNT